MEQYRRHVGPELYVVRGLLDERLCREIRQAMDAGRRETAEVLGPAVAEQQDVRRAEHIEIDAGVLERVERLLDDQQPAIEAYFGVALAGREGAGFLRYPDGGFYLPHRDQAEDTGWPEAARRAVTAVVFLNDTGFTGGVLRVDGVDLPPAAGTLAAFPAATLHEVTPVRGAPRDTIVDWFLSHHVESPGGRRSY